MSRKVKLGVNIDHVATLRNARGDVHPSVLEAAKLVKSSGGDGITVHLREDRRHIRDGDVFAIKENVDLPINFECAATTEMLQIALKLKPNSCCLVPEKREELTTEGGLNLESNFINIEKFSKTLKQNGILTSLFLDPDEKQIELASKIGAEIIEFHTGSYCNFSGNLREVELQKISKACKIAEQNSIASHAGHGLTYNTVPEIVKIPQVEELNIGHFMMGEALFDGLPTVIKKMQKIINENI